METVMDTVVIERVATSTPVKSRLQFGHKHLAFAGLALAITLGGVGYGRYWWTVGRFIESTDDPMPGVTLRPSRRMSRASLRRSWRPTTSMFKPGNC
jgi:hypothetical protein